MREPRSSFAGLIAALCLLATTPAKATPAPPDGSQGDSWDVVAAVASDLASITLLAVGGGLYNNSYQQLGPKILDLGLLGLALGGPLNHIDHGQPERALGSFGIRALGALAAVGMVYGAVALVEVGDTGSVSSGASVVAFGLLVGSVGCAVTALAIDDAYLARVPVVPRQPATVSFGPGFVLTPGGGYVGFNGRF